MKLPPLPPLVFLLAQSPLLHACTATSDGPPVESKVPAGDDTAGTDSGPPESPDPATVPLSGTCEMEDDLGGFLVKSVVDETTVEGTVADGVIPASVLEEIGAEGDCRVLRRNNPYCSPTCDPGEVCDFDGTCLPYPANQDLGTVTLTGMVQPVTMEPLFPGNSYYDTTLPHPGFVPGSLLSLEMAGGIYGPVSLYGVGVEPLDMAGVSWKIESGVALDLTWPAPTGPIQRSEVRVSLSIDQHGVSPSALSCRFDDDGSGSVPAAMMSLLVDVGVTGFPTGSIERLTGDRVEVSAGCFDLKVSEPRTVSVDVVGHTPCIADPDCPAGQSCNLELQTCY